MSSEGPTLYVRRLVFTATPLTKGKLYLVENSPTRGEFITSDNGVVLTLAPYNSTWNTSDEYFTRVWVWPNGTEVDEI